MRQYVSYAGLRQARGSGAETTATRPCPKAKLASAEYNILRNSSLVLFHIGEMLIQRESLSTVAKCLRISEKMLQDWIAKDFKSA